MKAIGSLTPEQLELRIAPHLRSIGLIVKHLIRPRAGWLYKMLGEGGPEVAALAEWEPEGTVPPPAELVRGLEVTFRAWQECLQRWTPEDLACIFEADQWGRHFEVSRQWVVWHVIEHDLHHGGEIFFSLGALGLPTPDL